MQKLAREKYALWKRDPYHPSLRFEERRNGVCVVRIGEHYRALGLREGDVIAWFWIGTHEEYNRFYFSICCNSSKKHHLVALLDKRM